MSNLYKYISSLAFIALYISGQFAYAEENIPEIGIVEKLDQHIPKDIKLVDEQGDTVLLHTLIDKPTIIAFVYYRCPGVCTPLMDGIADIISKSDLQISQDYQVFTVSFDYKESTELAVRKKHNYMNMVADSNAEAGWKFFTSDSSNARILTQSLGFYYKAQANDYIHNASLIFLSEEGKVTRYLNGTQFLPFEFKMAVLETSEGRSGPTINKILQYCYSYDPKGQTYVLNFTRVTGVLIMAVLLSVFIILSIKPLSKKIKKQVS